jgi:hypothetical protein
MRKQMVIVTVLAFGLFGGTLMLSVNGMEQARAQQYSADQLSNLALAVPPHSESDDRAAAPTGDKMASSLRVQGNAEAVQLNVRHKTLGSVLSMLAANFNIVYKSSLALNEEINGSYAGSLGRVLSRVLDGYDYVIKREDSKLDVTILDRSGGRAVAVPSPHPVSERRAQIRASRL